MAPRNNINGDGGDRGSRSGGICWAIARTWSHSYIPDYLAFAALLAAYLLIQFFVEPFHRLFYINDLRIAFPHAEVERVPVWLNFVYSLFFPLGALLVWNAVVPRLSSSASSSSSSSRAERYPSSFHRHHNAVLGLAISLILASFLTDVVKNTVGRPRPDLLARCQPAPSTPRDTLLSIDVCTTSSATEHHRLHDGWRSFPSGHSSFAFAGLGYLSLFLAGALRVFRDRRRLWRALVCLAPLVAAALIAIGRCQDYRHDVYDVSVGSVLGFTVAVFAYRRYWPRLDSPMCHLPYPAPGSDDDDNDEFDFDNGNEDGRGAFRRVRARDLEDGPIIGRGPGPITTATAGYDSNELTVFSPPRVRS